MSIQIPITEQERRLSPVAQSYVDPIIVKDDRGEALRGFGQALGEMASSVRKRPGGATNDPPMDSADDVAKRDDADLGQAMQSYRADDPATREDADNGSAARLYRAANASLGPVHWQDFEDGKAEAAGTLANLHAFGDPYIDNAASDLAPGAPNFTPDAVGKLDAYIDAQKQSLVNPAARAAFDAYAPAYRQEFIGRALRFEAGQRLQWRADSYNQSARQWNDIVSRDPAQFSTALALLSQTVPQLDGAGGNALYDSARTSLIQSAAGAALQQDPQALGDTIARAEQGENVDSPLVRAMSPEERMHYQSLATAEVFNQQSTYRENLKTRAADASSSYMATGAANNPPTLAEFIRGFGEQEGRRLTQRLNDDAYAGQLYLQIKTLPNVDLEDMLVDADLQRGPAGAQQERQFTLLAHAVKTARERRDADPISYALDTGSYGLAPIKDFEDVTATAAELGRRGREAQDIGKDYATAPAVLSLPEIRLFDATLKAQPVEGQKALLAGLIDGIANPDFAESTLRVASAVSPAIAVAGLYTLRDRAQAQGRSLATQPWGGSGQPDVPDLILQGAVMRDPAQTSGAAGDAARRDAATPAALPAQAQLQPGFDAVTGGAFASEPGKARMYMEAAKNIYVALREEQGGSGEELDSGLWTYAIKLATGSQGTPRELGISPSADGAGTGPTTKRPGDRQLNRLPETSVVSPPGLPSLSSLVPSGVTNSGAAVEASVPEEQQRQQVRSEQTTNAIYESAQEGRALAQKENAVAAELEDLRAAAKNSGKPIDRDQEARLVEKLKSAQRESKIWNSHRLDVLWEARENGGGLNPAEEEELRARQAISVMPGVGAMQFGPKPQKNASRGQPSLEGSPSKREAIAVRTSPENKQSETESKPRNVTRMGTIRENDAAWRQLRNHWDDLGYGEILSPANRQAIAKGRRPIVDEAWVKAFPEDAGLVGERISPHHIGGYHLTVPLPKTRHRDAHLPGGTKSNSGGPGSALPFYPSKPDK